MGLPRASAQPSPPAADSAYAARADVYLAGLVARGRWMGVVRVEAGGRVYERAVGPADASGAPLRRDDVFRVGSLTKPMAAVATLRLAERGLVGLDEPACGYVPEACRGRWADVTVRQLLNHTAGLPEYTERPTFPWMKDQPASPEALLASVRGVNRVHAPGERFAYSNTHFVLLGAVLEAATGRPFGDVLAAEVARPLGLARTGYGDGAPAPVAGFLVVDDRMVAADSLHPSVAFAAGGAVSTAADLAAFLRGALSGPLLTPASRTAMLTPATANGYALGWVAVPYRGPAEAFAGAQVVWHDGAIDGFRSLALSIPERDVRVVVLANLFDADADGIGAALTTLLGGDPAPSAGPALPESLEPEPEPEVVPLAEADLAAVVGTYRLAEGFEIDVRVREARVFVQATGQPELEAFAHARDRFFLRAVPARLAFARGADGRAARVTLFQGGAEVTGARVAQP